MTAKEELAALKKEIEALKSALLGKEDKPPPKSTFVPMSDAEWRDQMHQMQERRMSMATPPSVARYFEDGVTAADCADLRQQAHRPAGRPGMIPDSQQPASPRSSAGDGTGWAREIPLSNPPGTGPGSPADRIVDEFDRRDRAELIEREAKLRAMQKLAEGK
jgi:hypothetical protein